MGRGWMLAGLLALAAAGCDPGGDAAPETAEVPDGVRRLLAG